MKPVVFHREARAEVLAAVAYYNGKRSGLGREFQATIKDAIARIV